MGQARVNARRRRQAKLGYTHLAPQQRPNYKKVDAATSARRLIALIDKERRIKQAPKRK